MQKYRERGVKGPGPTTTDWEVITTYKIGSSGRGVMETIANTGSRGVRVSHQESLDPRANIDTGIRRVAAVVGIASIAASLTQAPAPNRKQSHQLSPERYFGTMASTGETGNTITSETSFFVSAPQGEIRSRYPGVDYQESKT